MARTKKELRERMNSVDETQSESWQVFVDSDGDSVVIKVNHLPMDCEELCIRYGKDGMCAPSIGYMGEPRAIDPGFLMGLGLPPGNINFEVSGCRMSVLIRVGNLVDGDIAAETVEFIHQIVDKLENGEAFQDNQPLKLTA